jgi:hypothetical protein
MSTWLDDLRRTNPALAADYALVGNQPATALRNMVKALTICSRFNTAEENARLAAAKRILRNRKVR